jgi:hypothetical protein
MSKREEVNITWCSDGKPAKVFFCWPDIVESRNESSARFFHYRCRQGGSQLLGLLFGVPSESLVEQTLVE